jgi:hypothetical protein
MMNILLLLLPPFLIELDSRLSLLKHRSFSNIFHFQIIIFTLSPVKGKGKVVPVLFFKLITAP